MEKELDKILKDEKLIIRALNFAVYAHDGQYRKLGDSIPYVIHPIKVARLVRESKEDFVDNYLLSAAYLHDIVEDTKYDLDFIEKYFGYRVSNYVDKMTEKDKNLPWEVRKQETIDKIKHLKKDEELLMLSDKLSNIMDMNENFSASGKDFSKFNRGAEQQEWYYRNLYKEFENNSNINERLLRMFKDNINEVFDRNMDDYFKEEKNSVKIKQKEMYK